jgi:phosphatidylglycerophosphate synthase
MLILLLAQIVLMPKQYFINQLTAVRVGLILLAMAAIAISLFGPTVQIGLMSLPVFLIVFGEETIGRWIFYASRLLDVNDGNRTSIYQV